MTLEVNFDLGFGISDLNYMGSYALLACICFPELNDRHDKCVPETSVASAHAGKNAVLKATQM